MFLIDVFDRFVNYKTEFYDASSIQNLLDNNWRDRRIIIMILHDESRLMIMAC